MSRTVRSKPAGSDKVVMATLIILTYEEIGIWGIFRIFKDNLMVEERQSDGVCQYERSLWDSAEVM